MDRRSWPWKKKSSDKTGTEKTVNAADSVGASLASVGSLGDQENYKKVNYVQISLDSYKHLTSLEDQVNAFEDQVKLWQNQVMDLKERLSAANSEMTGKDNLVKQHAKVAEEAVSGWEKADAEASALKRQLESVTLLKLTAEDRASHLDGALKECTRQIRIVKEEHEHKLHEAILTKTKQCDKIKLDLEEKITDLDQRLLRSATENATLARSLQERSTMLMKISEEKSQAVIDNKLLKENIQSCEKEINSLKYELHVLSKELDIRNEEKNMILRSAEAANKQHLESVKKIAKLETESQKLRGLLRKKLPGPAALAQMKQQVDNWGCDSKEPKSLQQRPSVKNSKTHLSSLPEFSTENLRLDHKDTEFLTKRLSAMEEELKMVKESLATRNSELQSSRDTCAKMVGRIKNLEVQLQILNQRRSSPRPILEVPTEDSSQNASNPHSVASLSEDGFDDDGSFSESWVTTSISDISHFEKAKHISKGSHPVCENTPELMNDFLETERMAHSGSNMTVQTVGNDDSVNAAKRGELLLSKMKSSKNSSADQAILDSCDQELVDAVSHIRQFLLSLCSNMMQVHDSSTIGSGFIKDYENFSASMDKFLSCETSLIDFVLNLSRVLVQANELKFIVGGCNPHEGEVTSSDRPSSTDGCNHIPHSDSSREVLNEGNLNPGFPLDVTSCKCLELEQLTSEKVNMQKELAICNQDFESTKLQLQEVELLLAKVRSELTSAKNLNSLAETQLKCMAESYKSLEIRTQQLEADVKLLQSEKESLDAMLQEEKCSHQDALARCKDLEDRMHRKDNCSICSSPTADFDIKRKQEREIAVAAAKLAECQDTIYLLGKQLKALHPQADTMESQYKEKLQTGETSVKDKLSHSFRNPQGMGHSHEFDRAEMDRALSFDMRGAFEESPIHNYDSSSTPSSGELNQRANKSYYSSALTLVLEKRRGFSRYIPSKDKY